MLFYTCFDTGFLHLFGQNPVGNIPDQNASEITNPIFGEIHVINLVAHTTRQPIFFNRFIADAIFVYLSLFLVPDFVQMMQLIVFI
ncbi:MAG: hypothetical protein EPGJADBJ_05124 [Saprospiraceae bacterium]|nr:hypothetical protein [Saprospiraceae bacterium]